MNRKIKNFFQLFAALFSFVAPYIARAQSPVTDGLGKLSPVFGSGGGLTRAQSVSELILQILNLLLVFSGIIAVIFIIIGGYFYITSAGNEEQAEKGRNTLTNALIGVVLVIMSYVLVNVISNLVLGNGGGYGGY